MKRKYFFVILFLILIVVLCGCNGMVTPATDEAKIENVLQEYFLSISEQNWSKAKNCCVYGSQRYYATCTMESLINNMYQLYSVITITCYMDNVSVSIYGDFADASFYLTLYTTADYYYDSQSGYGVYYLQKIGNNWKIYDNL
jgi:hypothetical protein